MKYTACNIWHVTSRTWLAASAVYLPHSTLPPPTRALIFPPFALSSSAACTDKRRRRTQ
eukprot:CAMPEP_0173234524 /NCGR_PEP_ID=MMETSP1142-20121109/10273_1 /TAXON_ID=483371 /ORGANISM="non described non described, Strain CCMP2298" /LENGTH=58 /DNA_ID=CAMNT_0014164573 /DNA_START=68 /DNA_END=241 /DNA_ORIENTATION=+